MRCAHPDEFVPQVPSDNNPVKHARIRARSPLQPGFDR